jgi:DnaJ domain
MSATLMSLLERILSRTSPPVYRLEDMQLLADALGRARTRHHGELFVTEAAKTHGGLPRLLCLTAVEPRLMAALLSSAPTTLVDTQLASLHFRDIVPLIEHVVPAVSAPIVARWGDRDLAYRLAYRAATREPASGSPMPRSLVTGVNVPNHYVILGVPRGACPKTLKEAYRRLAWTHHPDRVAHMPRACREDRTEAMALMREINHSYEVLAEPTLRVAYESRLPVRANLYPPAPWFRRLRELGVTTYTPACPSGRSEPSPPPTRAGRMCIGPVAALPAPVASARFS